MIVELYILLTLAALGVYSIKRGMALNLGLNVGSIRGSSLGRLTNVSGMMIDKGEVISGVAFGFVFFVISAFLFTLVGATYLPNNAVSAQIAGYGFIALFAIVYALLMTVVLGYLGDHIVDSVVVETVLWAVIGALGLFGNFLNLLFYGLGFLVVIISAAAAHAINDYMS